MDTLTLKNIHKLFKQGEGNLVVLKGISTIFTRGSTYAITGTSGSGKSTLLHIIAGIEHPTDGTIFFNNEAITKDEPGYSHFLRHSIGIVFQQPYLIQELTVLENIMLKGLIAKKNYQECEFDAYQLLKKMNLLHKALETPATLSGGQQQRVAIARALFNKPAFLLADEPTGSLDEKTGHEIVDFLLECQADWGLGLIVSSHDSYVARMMQTQYVLKEGMLV